MTGSIRPFVFPRMSTGVARLTQQLFSGCESAAVSCPSGDWRLRWLPVAPELAMGYVVCGRVGEEFFELRLDDFAPLLPAGSEPDADTVWGLPATLASVVLECGAATLLNTGEHFFGKRLTLDAVHVVHPSECVVFPKNTEAGDLPVFPFVLEQDGQTVHGTLKAAPDGVALPHLCAWWGQQSPCLAMPDGIRLMLTPVLQEFSLSGAELRTLHKNDFLVGAGNITEPLFVRFRMGTSCSLAGNIENGRLTMEGEIMRDAPETAEPLRALSLDEVPLRVSFTLDAVEMTVGQLAALQEGQVFTTTCDPDAPVTVLVNGQAIGQGRLVDISGRIAVQITRLSLPDRENQGEAARS